MFQDLGEQLQQHFEQWVLDSCYSYHMCPHRHWFVTYEKNFDGNVLISDDAPCKSVIIGSIPIRMHDGVVRTLIKVHHVLELEKNIVCMGALDSKGFSCWIEGGVTLIEGKGWSMKNQTGNIAKCLRTDNDLELCSTESNELLLG